MHAWRQGAKGAGVDPVAKPCILRYRADSLPLLLRPGAHWWASFAEPTRTLAALVRLPGEECACRIGVTREGNTLHKAWDRQRTFGSRHHEQH
jgi:hypothetical protein